MNHLKLWHLGEEQVHNHLAMTLLVVRALAQQQQRPGGSQAVDEPCYTPIRASELDWSTIVVIDIAQSLSEPHIPLAILCLERTLPPLWSPRTRTIACIDQSCALILHQRVQLLHYTRTPIPERNHLSAHALLLAQREIHPTFDHQADAHRCYGAIRHAA